MDQDPKRWGEREKIPNATLSTPNDSCIKKGSAESHFNILLLVRNKVTRQAQGSQITIFEEKGEQKLN